MKMNLLVVAAEVRDARFAAGVLEERGDHVDVVLEVPEALERLARGDIDVALVSLSLPRGDGLALVHHLRALYPLVDVIVLTTPQDLEEASHAMALGVLQTVMRPLTGDALLVAVDRARERRILLEQRRKLGEEARWGRLRTATYARCAGFVAEIDPTAVADRILQTCAEELALAAGAIYVPPFPGAQTYMRTSVVASGDELPATLDAAALALLDPTQPVQEDDHVIRILFLGSREASACAVLVPESPLDELGREALTIVASLGTAALAAARKVDAIARTGLKDPETSAYTFAYFGDVAGREIDRAARHDRRFALLTIALEGVHDLAERVSPDFRLTLRRLVTDAVLSAVRDSDVLARVEDDEFYLLLPETGLLGALAARRRILARFASLAELPSLLADAGVPDAPLDLVCGVSVYPLDGRDLGRLLRVSRRRSERSREGVWRRMGLAQLDFWDALDRLLGSDDDVVVQPSGSVKLHEDLAGAQGHRACHAVLPRALLPSVATWMAGDAVRHRAPGVLYAMGDPTMCFAMQEALAEADRGPVRGWVLAAQVDSAISASGTFRGLPAGGRGERILRVDGDRADDRVLLLALTELGGYVLIARSFERADERVLAYHASDLDLVDGLVASLQRTYHLQPEVGG